MFCQASTSLISCKITHSGTDQVEQLIPCSIDSQDQDLKISAAFYPACWQLSPSHANILAPAGLSFHACLYFFSFYEGPPIRFCPCPEIKHSRSGNDVTSANYYVIRSWSEMQMKPEARAWGSMSSPPWNIMYHVFWDLGLEIQHGEELAHVGKTNTTTLNLVCLKGKFKGNPGRQWNAVLLFMILCLVVEKCIKAR